MTRKTKTEQMQVNMKNSKGHEAEMQDQKQQNIKGELRWFSVHLGEKILPLGEICFSEGI